MDEAVADNGPEGGVGSGRLARLDALKGVAIIAVVAIHALATGVVGLDRRPVAALGGILTASVPVFMAAAVWVAVREYELRGWRAISRRLPRLAIPYGAATVAYVGLAHAAGGPDLVQLRQRPWASVALFGGGWYHLYFLPAFVQILVLVPLLARVVHRRLALTVALTAVAVIGLVGPIATGAPADALDLRWALVWLGPALIGVAMATGAVRVRRGAAWLAAGLGILAVETIVAADHGSGGATAYARLGVLAATAGAVALGCRDGGAPRWLVALGRRSLGVYLLHPAVLLALSLLRDRAPYGVAAVAPVTAVATAVAWALTAALAATPAAPVVGARRRVRGGRRGLSVEPLGVAPAAPTARRAAR